MLGRRLGWIFEDAMTIVQNDPTAVDLWAVLIKEIVGIQVLWETVERVHLDPEGQALSALAEDTPLLYRLIQTALMESILVRLSRLMDPANSGRKDGDRPNLSLQRLVALEPGVTDDEIVVRSLWNGCNLKTLRDKYLSHNDLTRSLTEPHTLNIPLEPADIEAMRELVASLRHFRREVHRRLNDGVAYLDESARVEVQCDVDTLNRSLLAAQLFFGLLPHHEILQQAWHGAGRE